MIAFGNDDDDDVVDVAVNVVWHDFVVCRTHSKNF